MYRRKVKEASSVKKDMSSLVKTECDTLKAFRGDGEDAHFAPSNSS